MEEIKVRYFRRDQVSIEEKKIQEKFTLYMFYFPSNSSNRKPLDSLDQLADEVVNKIPKEPGGLVYLYRSQNKDVEGKPFLYISRQTIFAVDAVSDQDELLELKDLISAKIQKKL